MSDANQTIDELGRRARDAAADLALRSRGEKDAVLLAMADALVAATDEILAANAQDVERGRAGDIGDAMIDRLTLTAERIAAIADQVRGVAALPDPVGEVVRGYTMPNGVRVQQIRVPMGVVGIIYEGRPNVTVDGAVLCLKSGNAVLLRGSSSAASSNAALVEILRRTAAEHGFPADAIQGVPSEDRATVSALLHARGLVDVVIPRGGAGLIQHVVTNSTVPVIETGVGNVHVYVDSSADEEMALAITENSKVRRPSVCNAAETLLVHHDVAESFLPKIAQRLRAAGVTLHADEQSRAILGDDAVPATDEDWDTEYLSLDLAVGVVDSLDAAVGHIREHGSGHTEAIVTSSLEAARRFSMQVDAAAVMVNASTAFTDGGEFGFGAEIGISTQKLHARGPMALPELTTTTYLVQGEGQIRGAS
ncbi:glutamate-5-semialdehyde dehydrogenase [Epidermidibacterium keratini]|uniref:Gamma-glutamyl phosphate reductase n=1 Tax=Epidermidibacterium keratini TaxID=1891644 RepID=A0A7L4YKD9_9ACTN|nr:glutamate-5-semialdehyde dehydrogenase [Epidermidibacterium keratini]QHB99352.1 glutamate-5-semialdehyde dehydrogenase [Epidermidibacterium keratini]